MGCAIQAREDVVAGLGAVGQAVCDRVDDVEGWVRDFFVPFFRAEFGGAGFGVEGWGGGEGAVGRSSGESWWWL